jgi:hypothetical protein
MNHYVTLGIVAIVAAMTLTAVGFAIPQQALAYRYHNNHNNSIKVDQQVNQLNDCTTPPPPPPPPAMDEAVTVAVAVAVQYALTQATIQPTYTNNHE